MTQQIGALCAATNESIQTKYEYDQWGNITKQTEKVDCKISTIQYSYDEGNRIIGLTYPNGERVEYKRDELGRVLDAAHNGAQVISERTYRADGRFKQQTFANGLVEVRLHDVQGRLTSQEFGSEVLGERVQLPEKIDYQYDANGNLLKKHNQLYGYDPLNRLVNDQVSKFHYDGNGNRLQALGSESNQQLAYYGQSNQLFSVDDIQIEHDGAGNQLNELNGNRYHYNQAGKLVKVSNGERTVARYLYNAFSQRVEKTVDGLSTKFSYNLAGQLIQESANDSSSVTYLWVDNEAVAHIQKNTTTYLVSDHLSTPRYGIDREQKVVWKWISDGFGTLEPANDPDQNGVSININLRFPGQYSDAETGLYFNWYRYYNPKTGRYTTSDPIGLLAGVNTYGYVDGNPVVSYDLTGLTIVVSGSDADKALVNRHLDSLSANSPSARALISTLRNQNEVIKLVVRDSFVDNALLLTGQSGSSYNPITGVISYFPTQGVDEFGVPNEIVLGHELVHAYHDIIFGRNSLNTSRTTLQSWTINGISGGGGSVSFNGACYPDHSENEIRSDYGLGDRG